MCSSPRLVSSVFAGLFASLKPLFNASTYVNLMNVARRQIPTKYCVFKVGGGVTFPHFRTRFNVHREVLNLRKAEITHQKLL